MIQPQPQTQMRSRVGEPTWEIAELFPTQGDWSEEEYLLLNTNRLVELNEHHLEVLPMPSELHQIIALFLYRTLQSFSEKHELGLTLAAPLRVRLWKGRVREPDVVFMLAKNRDQRGDRYWQRADLVMEVVSEDDPDRDLVIKRDEYAKAGITEYWIIEPKSQCIRVLWLETSAGTNVYRESPRCVPGQAAESLLLPGFTVDVRESLRSDRAF